MQIPNIHDIMITYITETPNAAPNIIEQTVIPVFMPVITPKDKSVFPLKELFNNIKIIELIISAIPKHTGAILSKSKFISVG